jgi:hypothetical protein
MAKPWQPPTARLNAKPRSFPEVVKDIRYCVWSVNRLRPNPGTQDQFTVWALGSGFFVAPNVFLTCNHVVNGPQLPHQAGDEYQFVQRLSAVTASQSPRFTPVLGADLHLYPDRDAAIFQINWTPQPYASVGYSDLPEGCEIGVAGYPLPQIVQSPTGQGLINFIYRVAKGVVTATITQSIQPVGGPATTQINTIEVNFLFVPGNSGGPIFDAETGRVFAFVHGFKDSEIVQRFAATNSQNVNQGAPTQHVQALHAVYSLGIRLDAIRTELEGFGVTL